MRYQIVKLTYANEESKFYIRTKGKFFGWNNLLDFSYYHSGEVIYYEDLQDAIDKIKILIDAEMAETLTSIEIVYDTGEPK